MTLKAEYTFAYKRWNGVQIAHSYLLSGKNVQKWKSIDAEKEEYKHKTIHSPMVWRRAVSYDYVHARFVSSPEFQTRTNASAL